MKTAIFPEQGRGQEPAQGRKDKEIKQGFGQYLNLIPGLTVTLIGLGIFFLGLPQDVSPEQTFSASPYRLLWGGISLVGLFLMKYSSHWK